MREQPDGAALLAIARDVLRKELMPLLPKERAYEVLMVVNAMSIAERQLRFREQPVRDEQQALQELLHEQGDVVELNRRLAQKVRAGDLDGDSAGQQLLWQSVVQRVRESAPKALLPYGLE